MPLPNLFLLVFALVTPALPLHDGTIATTTTIALPVQPESGKALDAMRFEVSDSFCEANDLTPLSCMRLHLHVRSRPIRDAPRQDSLLKIRVQCVDCDSDILQDRHSCARERTATLSLMIDSVPMTFTVRPFDNVTAVALIFCGKYNLPQDQVSHLS